MSESGEVVPILKGPTIFVSYSHLDDGWKERLKTRLQALESRGHPVDVWDDRRIDVGETWRSRITWAMDRAQVAVCLISDHYLQSTFCMQEEIPHLLERRERAGMLLIPIIVDDCQWREHAWLTSIQHLPQDGRPLAGLPAEQADAILSSIGEHIEAFLRGKLTEHLVTTNWPPLPGERIDRSRLPESGTTFFGREEELRRLHVAWNQGRTRIVAATGRGGAGKSHLVGRWLDEIEREHFRGASRVFAWSFYNQGTAGLGGAADMFFEQALAFFGDPDPAEGTALYKAERLARLAVGSILILDGLEPLQSDVDASRGQITDSAVRLLLRRLLQNPRGLCVVTSRQSLPELGGGTRVERLELDELPLTAACALLRQGRVKGSNADLEGIVREFGRHALTVKLLASYLRQLPERSATLATRLPPSQSDADGDISPQLARVLAALEGLLGEGPERDLLRILGLFERPARISEIAALLHAPTIPHLTSHLVKGGRRDEVWKAALERLRDLDLVSPEQEPDSIDTHPLVREHFAIVLRRESPRAWHEGHDRLCIHLTSTAPRFPSTLAEMTPLYLAIRHGCEAGRHLEVLEQILALRITRGPVEYGVKKLAAFGPELAARTYFFARDWTLSTAGLSGRQAAWLLSTTAFILNAQGRVDEATRLFRLGYEASIQQDDWQGAAVDGGNLSSLQLLQGDVDAAVDIGREAVGWADRSGSPMRRLHERAVLGEALYCRGEAEAARQMFVEAERIQRDEYELRRPILYSLQGVRYGEFLLGLAGFDMWATSACSGQADAAQASSVCSRLGDDGVQRAETALSVCRQNHWVASIALHEMTLGKALIVEGAAAGPAASSETATKALHHLNRAVEGLQRAGEVGYLPRALLARAAARRLLVDFAGAHEDLADAYDIAAQSTMKLFLVDCAIEAACQAIARGDAEALSLTRRRLEEAQRLADACHYRRREAELHFLATLVDRAESSDARLAPMESPLLSLGSTAGLGATTSWAASEGSPGELLDQLYLQMARNSGGRYLGASDLGALTSVTGQDVAHRLRPGCLVAIVLAALGFYFCSRSKGQ